MAWRTAIMTSAAVAIMAAAPAKDVSELGWLSGAWVSEASGKWTEELWTAARGGVLLGVNRSGRGARATGFEFMRIAADQDGTISFWASPGGKAPVAFPLISSRPREAVFENPANDYPTRIVYRRKGEALLATISGPAGQNPTRWTFRRP